MVARNRHRRARGSNNGGVAQLGEHLLCKQGVIGSIPFTSTKQKTEDRGQRTEDGNARRVVVRGVDAAEVERCRVVWGRVQGF